MPGALATRFNLDPVLISALLILAVGHVAFRMQRGAPWQQVAAGWAITTAALVSPLCALSVALFAARVAQHMILLFIAAPLIASGLPGRRVAIWPAAGAFMVLLWLWHMPVPYDATLRSTAVYWAMHLSLFCSGVWLWRGLLGHAPEGGSTALAAGVLTSVQMGLLGALLTLGRHAWFSVHYLTTSAWGLSPLADQQLGGVLMWVPGGLLFVWVALRGLASIGFAGEVRAA